MPTKCESALHKPAPASVIIELNSMALQSNSIHNACLSVCFEFQPSDRDFPSETLNCLVVDSDEWKSGGVERVGQAKICKMLY